MKVDGQFPRERFLEPPLPSPINFKHASHIEQWIKLVIFC